MRAAVIASDGAGGSNTIDLGDGTYPLAFAPSGSVGDATTGDLDVSNNLTIMGTGTDPTTIDAGHLDRGFHVASAASLSLVDVAVVNGKTGPKSAPDENGGAIEASGTGQVTLETVRLAGNDAGADGGALAVGVGGFTIDGSTLEHNSSLGDGGGVFATEPGPYSGATLPYQIQSSTIDSNTAGGDGGGLRIHTFSRVLNLGNVTVAANSAGGSGGGLAVEVNPAPVSIVNSTVVANQAGVSGGNVATTGSQGVLSIQNSIVGGGVGGGTPSNCAVGSFGNDGGHNLFFTTVYSPTSVDNCFAAAVAPGDILSNDARLSSGPGLDQDAAGQPNLADNGGLSPTIALLPGSPAIDGANPSWCTLPPPQGAGKLDERGVGRFPPGIATCDIGAYEAEGRISGPSAPVGPFQPLPNSPIITTATASSTPPPAPAAGPAAAAAKKAAVTTCKSLRRFPIHIQNVKKFGLVSAIITVDRRKPIRVSGGKLTARIDLRNLPKGVFRVKIVARTHGGRVIRYTRVYHPCHHPRLAGHKHLLL